MKKEVQRMENEIVKSAMERMNEDLKKVYGVKRLRSCSAEVLETENFYILISYRTNIACIEKNTDTLYDYLRGVYGYTATSAQHISKFKKDYGAGKWGCEHEYRYYEV